MACRCSDWPGMSRRRRIRRTGCPHNRQADSRIALPAHCSSSACTRRPPAHLPRHMSRDRCNSRSSIRCYSHPARCRRKRPGPGTWPAHTERRHSGWPRLRRRSCQMDRCHNRARHRSRPAQARIRRPIPRRSAVHSRIGSPCRLRRTPSAASSSRTTRCHHRCRTRCRTTRQSARMSWVCIATFHIGWDRRLRSSARTGTGHTGP